MMPALLFGLAVAVAVAGIILVVVGIVGTSRPAAPTSRTRRTLHRLWAGEGLSTSERRARQLVAAAAVVSTTAVWLITTIPIAGIIAGLATIGVPWLFTAGRAEQRAITKLEALEAWTRRLTDLVRTGLGLNQAIIVSTRDAPDAIAGDLRTLEAQLRAGVPILVALDRFAAALGDATGDEVIVALRLHATDRGQRLADILGKISENIGREITMRREVWASRADPRLTTRFMTILTIVVLTFLFANPVYMRPYGTLLGQVVLTASLAVYAVLLIWIRRLSSARQVPRVLDISQGSQP
ncbi:type II secretion system F family protein [Actinoplanes sp. G11-F43]|uniref:type II secretion system F family protein n=1 Tax=Actinoplanes sp. G11-F43 TaxID=3424130 RepID=UPI003D333851